VGRSARRPAGRLLTALGAVLALALGGCVEADEDWKFTRDGSGSYALTLKWNADLLARVKDAVGPQVLARFEGRAFPLRLEEWREGLKSLPHVEIKRLEERDLPGGWRELSVHVAFGTLQDLLGWEVLSRRTVRIDPPTGERVVKVHMTPLTHLPVLDPLFAAETARRSPPPPAEGEGAPRDPPPVERLGVDAATQVLVERMLAPLLSNVRFTFRLEFAGRVRSASAPATKAAGSTAEYTWGRAELAPGRSRSIDVTYVPGEFDTVPLSAHVGDAPAAGSGGAPR
jgi:hypothetical protein